MALKRRDLAPEESRLYSNPSVFTDPKVMIVFTDPKSDLPFLKKGFLDRDDGFVRSWKLLQRGMLIQVECKPFVLWDHLRENKFDRSVFSKEGIEEARKPIPDFVYIYSLWPLPDFTPEWLSQYIHGFTERSIQFLNFDNWVADFVRSNQKRVIYYLQKKLEKGNLRFYGGRGGSPLKYGPIAFGDVTDPEKPKLLYLVYGLRPLLWEPPKGPHGYIPWKPCLESSKEAYENTTKLTVRMTTHPASAQV